MSRKRIFRTDGTAALVDGVFPSCLLPIVVFAVAIGLGILSTPRGSHAQAGVTPNQDAGQSAAPPPAAPQSRKKVVLPEGDGKAIAENACQACHELTNLTHASKSLEDWHETVETMIDNGADVPMDKVDILVKYLAKNFGPKTDSAASGSESSAHTKVELPDGDGKDTAVAFCQACHTLANLTTAHKNRDDWRETVLLMIDRGAQVPPDKVDPLVGYLAKNFGPKDAGSGSGTNSGTPSQAQ